MRIGVLAKLTDCDIETIRYYEKLGLLPEPGRTGSGYREYRIEHQERLQFIRHCRALQLSLREIRTLLDLMDKPSLGCGQVDQMLERQIERIREQRQALERLEGQLLKLRQRCDHPKLIEECGILKSLNDAGQANEDVPAQRQTKEK